ncbi:MAG: hypothetical protein M3R53_01745 [Candidatus Eremiobacteraeota bacterium]|nr:hypothetical protein [Candidatus Eremiobacteraeota bacterium]
MVDADAAALDDAFLDIVRDWSAGGTGCDERRFDELALATCAYQLERNSAYRRYAASLGVDRRRPPATWHGIPAVPSTAFKETALATFDVRRAELEFHTSGTTDERAGKHFVEHARLYDASLLAGFDRFMLADGAKLRYLNLVPNPRYKRHSSLGYMLGNVSVLRGDGKAEYFLDESDVDVDGFARASRTAAAEAQPLCVTGTAFAFATLLDELEGRGHRFEAPAGSRVMETGGFKGRARIVEREELYARLEATLGIAQASIVAEYGMTELLSQYYDDVPSRTTQRRVKVAPPWLRTLVVDAAGNAVADGETGFLRHVDLGNRSSVVAIDTEDRGYVVSEGLVLLGRAVDAPLRGCSLDAEDLAPAAPVVR